MIASSNRFDKGENWLNDACKARTLYWWFGVE